MHKTERRRCRRVQLNYPVIVSSSWAIEKPAGYHYGEILDAGRDGIRLRVDNFGGVDPGSVLRLVCQPALGHLPDNRCMPMPLQGEIVWLDQPGNQFGLRYTY